MAGKCILFPLMYSLGDLGNFIPVCSLNVFKMCTVNAFKSLDKQERQLQVEAHLFIPLRFLSTYFRKCGTF